MLVFEPLVLNLIIYNCTVLSDCGQLSAPLNGVVIIAPNKTECGSVATYSCNTGYLLKGVLNRTCQVDGQWSDVMPFCSRKFALGC